jgi:hypothetical protein
MKVYFTAEELHTPEYKEYVQWMSNVWKLNDERNKRIEAENQALIEHTRPVITEKMLENARQLAKDLYHKRQKVFEKTK